MSYSPQFRLILSATRAQDRLAEFIRVAAGIEDLDRADWSRDELRNSLARVQLHVELMQSILDGEHR